MNSGICISETHRDVANRTTRSAGSATGPSWSVVAPIRHQSSAGSTFMMRRHPVDATRRGAPSCRPRRVLATGAARGMWASRLRPVEHCSCWSHAELCPSSLRGVHPWDPLARPSVHPWWSRGYCVPTPPADVTSAWEGPVATHRRLPGPSARSASFAHICIPEFILLLYGGSILFFQHSSQRP